MKWRQHCADKKPRVVGTFRSSFVSALCSSIIVLLLFFSVCCLRFSCLFCSLSIFYFFFCFFFFCIKINFYFLLFALTFVMYRFCVDVFFCCSPVYVVVRFVSFKVNKTAATAVTLCEVKFCFVTRPDLAGCLSARFVGTLSGDLPHSLCFPRSISFSNTSPPSSHTLKCISETVVKWCCWPVYLFIYLFCLFILW